MAEAKFIGISNLQHIADQFAPQVIMGPAYFAPEELDRLGISVISGVQFKNTKVVLARKGGTTRRKKVGEEVKSSIGYLSERVLTAYLTKNRYWDNRDRYVESPYQVEGSAEFSYPFSEMAFEAIMKSYGEDIFANLFFGDIDNEKVEGKEHLSLYDGFHTLVRHDIDAGLISEANGNLVKSGTIDAPTDTEDFSAWTNFYAWYRGWSPALKRVPVLVYVSTETGMAISAAYTNKYHGNATVVTTEDNGNFKVKELPKVTFVPSDDWGKGDRMMATIPGNLEYGVNSLDSRSKIVVQEGSDNDSEDIIFQVQSIQGCRVLNILPSVFVINDGSIADITVTGDYMKDTVTVLASDASLGTVTVNGATPDNTKEYVEGTTLTLKATATGSNKFVKWSNGATAAEIQVVTKGQPEVFVAVFAKAGE